MTRKKSLSFADLANPAPMRWPTRGDRLFAPDIFDDAEIHSDTVSRFVFLMDGYKDAGDVLVEEALSDDVARNGLVYPILFCYRQFIELSLKWQIEHYGEFCNVEKPGNTHKLHELLRSFRKICHSLGGSDTSALVAVSKCVLEFHRMDKHSFTFRYAMDKSGVAYPVTTDRIGLARLRDVMNGIFGFFRGCDGYFEAVTGAMPR